MKLELKHIVGYLPYGLKGQVFQYKIDHIEERYEELTGIERWEEKNSYWGVTTKSNSRITLSSFKPILRPLSDLTKEIEVNGEKFVPIEKLQYILKFDDGLEITDCLQVLLHNLDMSSYYFPPNFFLILYEKLYEWHLDLHSLIEKGLAIDKNTIL